ncbi:DUF7878 domain-containing protein [Rufibacter latericius]|uniref:DUF7878 domain-containing protein n=1 Tax=Rufibacter latericius TaxID=2487040 RepID=A0A3M9N087_9BACT|nr:hypothetical protein [Rufibacter latericius]RNI30428.1 hypothetical protein EFB08_03945 [Rufibacter latericius]
MIEFEIGQLKRAFGDNKLFGDAYLDSVANLECSFDFKLGDDIVFSEVHWNLVEFTEQLVKWMKSGLTSNFQYYCMDIDEEDIFSFQKVNDKYIFRSVWAEAAIERLLQRQEIVKFIESIRKVTIERVLNELGVDIREIDKLELK